MKGLTVMYDHRGKTLGLIGAGIGLAAMVAERLTPFILLQKLNAHQHYALFLWLTLVALATVAYSKEKYDDERAKLIRLKAFQISFLIMVSTILSVALTMEVGAGGKEPIDGMLLFVFAALGILGYLFTFHLGLYFDIFWDYEDRSLWQNLSNIPRNKWGILMYFLVFAIVLLLATFIA